MDRQTFNKAGTRGVCPCCKKPTFLSRLSLNDASNSLGVWVASRDLIDETALSVYNHYQERTTRRAVTQDDGSVVIEEHCVPTVRCSRCGGLGSTHRFYWMALPGQGAAGPYCKDCAYQQGKGLTDEDGQQVEPQIFSANIDTKGLQAILAVAHDIRKAWGGTEAKPSTDAEDSPF